MGHSNVQRSPVYLGIDYHQHTLQLCVLDASGRVRVNKAVANDWSAVVRAIPADASGEFPEVRRVAIESCNGAADLADQLTELAGWTVELAHAGYVNKLKGSPDKTDWGDARLLADLTRVGYLPRAWRAPLWVRELRKLVRYRQEQVNERRNVKLRIGALLRDHRLKSPPKMRRWTKAWLAWLEDQACAQLPEASAWVVRSQLSKLAWLEGEVARIEARIKTYTADDSATAGLRELPGIGPVTAWVLRAEVGRFDRFDTGRALSRFAGLSPRNASSGQRQADAGLVKAGSKLLRATLIELAHRLGRCEPRWRQLRDKLRAAGKPGSVAAAAVANRYTRWLYHRMVEHEASQQAHKPTQQQPEPGAQRQEQNQQDQQPTVAEGQLEDTTVRSFAR